MHLDIHGVPQHSFSGWSQENPKVQEVRDVWAITGAALLIRRRIWKEVKGFDEQYGIGTFEDIDLCMKVRELGYNIIVSQKAMGEHYTNATTLQYQIQFPLQRNMTTFRHKWQDTLQWNEWSVW